MNKNSVLAFVIILGSVMFFTSPTYNKFYTEKILKKEYIYRKKTDKKEKKELNSSDWKKTEKKEIVENKTILLQKNNDSAIQKMDTLFVNDTFWLENEVLKVGIQSRGAAIISLKMKKYKREKKSKYIDLIEEINKKGGSVTIGTNNYSEKYYKIKNKGINKGESFIEFSLNDSFPHLKRFSLQNNSYEIGISIYKNDLPGQKIEIAWEPGIKESESQNKRSRRYKKILHISGANTQHMVMKKNEKQEPFSGTYSWIGVSTKYFLITVNNENNLESDIQIDAEKINKTEMNYTISIARMAEKNKEKFTLYAGPKERKELKKYGKNYEKVLFPVTGWPRYILWADKWFPWLADKVLLLLMQIQKIVKDYGIAILIVTLVSKIITYPMTLSSMKSMERMKDIQPKVNKIREKHKNNPQKMNQEIMELYKKEGVNPLNPGCLPMFLQAPVFISLYVVLQYSIEIRGTTTFFIPWITDLSKPEVLFSIAKILPNGIPMYGNNVALLPIIMAVLTFFQQKLTIKDPNQKMMIYFMPLFMLVLFNNFPSGLVLYWTFSSAIQLVQQTLLKKK